MATVENVGIIPNGATEMTMNCRQIAKKSTAKLALSAMKACEKNKANMDSEGETDSADDSESEHMEKEVKSVPNNICNKNGIVRTARKTMKHSSIADAQAAAMKEKQEKLCENGVASTTCDETLLKKLKPETKQDSPKPVDSNGCGHDTKEVSGDPAIETDKSKAERTTGSPSLVQPKELEMNENGDKPIPIIKNFTKIKLTLKSMGTDKKVEPLENTNSNNNSNESPPPSAPAGDRGNLFETFENKRSRPNTPNETSRPNTPLETGSKTVEKSDQAESKQATCNGLKDDEKETVEDDAMEVDNKPVGDQRDEAAPQEKVEKTEEEAKNVVTDDQSSANKDLEMEIPSDETPTDKKDAASSSDVKQSPVGSITVKVDETTPRVATPTAEVKIPGLGPDEEDVKPTLSATKEPAECDKLNDSTDDCRIDKVDSPMEDNDAVVICLSDSEEEGDQTTKKEPITQNNKLDQVNKCTTIKRRLSGNGSEQNNKRSRLDALVGKLSSTPNCVNGDVDNLLKAQVASVSEKNYKKADNKKAVLFSREDLQNLVEERLVTLVKKHTQDIVKTLKNKIDELQTSNDKWRDTAKNLQKQVLDLSIMHQRSAKATYRRPGTQKPMQRHFQSQVDPETIKAFMSKGSVSAVQKKPAPGSISKTSPVIAQRLLSSSSGKPANSLSVARSGIAIPSNLQPGTYLVSGNSITRQTATSTGGKPAQSRGASAVIDLTDEDEKKKTPSYPASSTQNATVRALIRAKQQHEQQKVATTPSTNTFANQRLVQLVNSPQAVYVQPNQVLTTNRYLTSGMVTLLRAPAINTQAMQVGQPAVLRSVGPQPVSMSNMHVVRRPPPLQSAPNVHPAPLPIITSRPSFNHQLLPKPDLQIKRVPQGIVLSWNMTVNDKHPEINNYQLFAYQETNSPPSTSLWKKVGDVKALPLPMACTLTQFQEGNKYHFAVRAIDCHTCMGPFSSPASIHLMATK